MTFTVSSSLTTFSTPLPIFSASKPDFTDFVVGGLIFSSNEGTETGTRIPRVLLLQRSLSDSYGGYWEGPGGGLDDTDNTVLEGAAREVLEESGLHVSRFVDLVSVDEWISVKPSLIRRVAKFTFWVEVYEAAGSGRWEDRVKLEEREHQAFAWATEEEVREGVMEKGLYRFVGNQGTNLLTAFELVKRSA